LWIGYFNRGLDQMDGTGGRVRHVEDEHVFCVNRILGEPRGGSVDVATANGLVRFSPAGSEEQVLTRASGLIADHVTDVAAYGERLALATPSGLTFLDRGGARSLYAFQGLVNNHVYALGVSGEELLAGTLGGISVIDGESVQANYTVGNSGLQHNWITAVARVGDEWMVGTYGAGVMAMDRHGRFHALPTATGPFNVAPNAMLVTPQHVFAGTLGEGLYVGSRASGRWTVIRSGLPSSNVTALAAGGGSIYVGTDNGLVRVAEQNFEP
jgi:ligand-binding sensor domain-containing protein